jgi:hypothetical protein
MPLGLKSPRLPKSPRAAYSAVGGRLKRAKVCGESLAFGLAKRRAQSFGAVTGLFCIGSLAWVIVRYFMNVNGENSVSEFAFDQIASTITNSLRAGLVTNMVFQDMAANFWIVTPQLSREAFRNFASSELYAPGLAFSTGVSIIPRVLGDAQRLALENRPEAELLRRQCCANDPRTGSSCAKVAGGGLFCSAGSGRYEITQNGPNGTLMPAVGNSSAEYMVVDMIEPFASNARVWGFNLLSNDARLKAWKVAKLTGLRTVTRRLNLVQATTAEYGVLVWLPVFADAAGSLRTALNGNLTGLTPVGSVNCAYSMQSMLAAILNATFLSSQFRSMQVFLFDDAVELNGREQYLASFGTGRSDAYTFYGNKSAADVTRDMSLVAVHSLLIDKSDLRWKVVVVADPAYLSIRRTNNPEVALVVSLILFVMSVADRLLGNPRLVVRVEEGEAPSRVMSFVRRASLSGDAIKATITSRMGSITSTPADVQSDFRTRANPQSPVLESGDSSRASPPRVILGLAKAADASGCASSLAQPVAAVETTAADECSETPSSAPSAVTQRFAYSDNASKLRD